MAGFYMLSEILRAEEQKKGQPGMLSDYIQCVLLDSCPAVRMTPEICLHGYGHAIFPRVIEEYHQLKDTELERQQHEQKLEQHTQPQVGGLRRLWVRSLCDAILAFFRFFLQLPSIRQVMEGAMDVWQHNSITSSKPLLVLYSK